MTNPSRRTLFHEQSELIDALYSVCGLVDAIFAIKESCASEQIKASATTSVYRALIGNVGDLLEAAERKEIIVSRISARRSCGGQCQ
ncbi:hypothetical protein [Methylosinus sp. KRF6]|uniref:hypothetical protein n=1 Tax=Methylosinus sp. KRF6 TaxID=2846853 RepID=UPI001C0E4273|nr:hypothetical protein [Methylosinus sp. KRF6]MBU3887212.1 hypothetical protein [Methylosinus sp. KRF6]